MISRSEWQVAESIRRRVIGEGGYMFHVKQSDGSWLHGFERRDDGGRVSRLFSAELMAEIRKHRIELRKLGEWLCREDSVRPPAPGGRFFRRPVILCAQRPR